MLAKRHLQRNPYLERPTLAIDVKVLMFEGLYTGEMAPNNRKEDTYPRLIVEVFSLQRFSVNRFF